MGGRGVVGGGVVLVVWAEGVDGGLARVGTEAMHAECALVAQTRRSRGGARPRPLDGNICVATNTSSDVLPAKLAAELALEQ